jgi:glycine/D-amino acid oxidase-like deaminating enzyme
VQLWTTYGRAVSHNQLPINRTSQVHGADISVVIGYTSDNWPHCGKVPGQGNHYILAGFNGVGMPKIFLTAKGIARMIREDVPFEETGISRLLKTTEERLKKDVTR